MFYDELKRVPIASIEKAISKAISELAGATFNCTISNIDLSHIEGARVDIFLSPPSEFDLVDEGVDTDVIG
ncbi:MAG TPA: hypothetical protein PLD10_23340 [Rhodopila sp.]|nr:hypothetical protein [Rhodopila sp.]